jgi:hypothetical protein
VGINSISCSAGDQSQNIGNWTFTFQVFCNQQPACTLSPLQAQLSSAVSAAVGGTVALAVAASVASSVAAGVAGALGGAVGGAGAASAASPVTVSDHSHAYRGKTRMKL